MGPWGARLVALLLSLLGLLPVLRRARQFGFGSHQAEGRSSASSALDDRASASAQSAATASRPGSSTLRVASSGTTSSTSTSSASTTPSTYGASTPSTSSASPPSPSGPSPPLPALPAVALMVCGQARSFRAERSLNDFVVRPWQEVQHWHLHVFGCFDKVPRSKLRFTAAWAYRASTQLERLGLCAQRILAFGAGGAAGVEYRWFVRWRPDFVAFKRVLHPSKLSQDCIACRFRQVGGMKQVTKGMLSWDPPNCLLRRESSIPCGDCDDQVFMVPQKFAQAALVDLTNRSKSAAYVFFVHKRRGENGLTMAWENNVRVHRICPLEVEGTLDKYVTKWRKWTMPSKYFNQTVGADPGQPALIRPCSCCCKTAPLRTCSTPRCDSVDAVAREHGGLCVP
ncbi:unnamed protein product [Effrenium voratum]|uniref:Uncharacterized protein n=1 Tax=Effrenium voratum TaxID=2562239 RepID=A0AA36IHW5_9DINO|nr:unnamed protein product [Effrenium voratum]